MQHKFSFLGRKHWTVDIELDRTNHVGLSLLITVLMYKDFLVVIFGVNRRFRTTSTNYPKYSFVS